MYKLTMDINLTGAEPKIAAVQTLERWASDGKIELIEAEAPRIEKAQPYGWPGAPPVKVEPDRKSGWSGSRRRVKKEPATGPNFKNVAGVLFPNKDAQKLNMSEINNVAHLIKHHGSRNEIFVTANTKDFIDGGRRELLKGYFGVIAMTPEEAVKMLTDMEGWK